MLLDHWSAVGKCRVLPRNSFTGITGSESFPRCITSKTVLRNYTILLLENNLVLSNASSHPILLLQNNLVEKRCVHRVSSAGYVNHKIISINHITIYICIVKIFVKIVKDYEY